MDSSKKNYYEILSLPRSASTQEIKDAYKKLALKWHPDKNPHNKDHCKQVFQRISEAYSVLSDPEKRRKYDKFGTVEDFDFDYDQFMKEFDFSDLFDMMFAGMKSMFGRKTHFRGANLRHFHMDFDKHMHDFKRKKDKMKKDEAECHHANDDWETESEEEVKANQSDDDFEDMSEASDEYEEDSPPAKKSGKTGGKGNKAKKPSKDEIDMFYLPMFVAENTTELKKGRGFKCKFDGEVISHEFEVLRHFKKEHKAELDIFISENQDQDLTDSGDLYDFGVEEEMLDPMMFLMNELAGKPKKKGKKSHK